MTRNTLLLPLVEDYVANDARGAARRLESMEEDEATSVLSLLPRQLKVQIIPHLQIGFAAALLKSVSKDDFAAIIKSLEPERTATVFAHLPEDVQAQFLPYLPDKARRHARELMQYPEDSIGRIMSLQYLSLRKSMKARDAIRQIRSGSKRGTSLYMHMSWTTMVRLSA